MLQFYLRKFLFLQFVTLLTANFIFATEKNNLTNHSTWILDYIHPVADFPAKGVQFQWYAHLLREPKAFRKAIKEFAKRYKNSSIDAIAGLDARGFIFGSALAYELKLPFIFIRKPGKLPGNVEKICYALEYGYNAFEIEKDSLQPGQKVLVIDDVVATGGTAAAACTLVERLGAKVVEVACLIELPFLKGREKISCPVFSLLAIHIEE